MIDNVALLRVVMWVHIHIYTKISGTQLNRGLTWQPKEEREKKTWKSRKGKGREGLKSSIVPEKKVNIRIFLFLRQTNFDSTDPGVLFIDYLNWVKYEVKRSNWILFHLDNLWISFYRYAPQHFLRFFFSFFFFLEFPWHSMLLWLLA